MSGSLAKIIFKRFGSALKVSVENESYSLGIHNQITYLDYAKELKYEVDDICQETCQVFLGANEFTFWGNAKGPIIIEPLTTLDYHESLRDILKGSKFRVFSPVNRGLENRDHLTNVKFRSLEDDEYDEVFYNQLNKIIKIVDSFNK
jgi:hypothetical protein